jgi:hypothetical protein
VDINHDGGEANVSLIAEGDHGASPTKDAANRRESLSAAPAPVLFQYARASEGVSWGLRRLRLIRVMYQT